MLSNNQTIESKGRKTKAKRERLEYLAKFVADERAKPLLVTVDVGRVGYKALWYDRTRNEFYLSTEGDGTPVTGQRWSVLAEALDAFDEFFPRRR